MSLLYIEYLFPIYHYFKTVRQNEFIFDFGIPFFVGIIVAIVGIRYGCTIKAESANELFKSIITLLSILIGFTISSMTILTSTSEKLDIETERRLHQKRINLYQLTNIIFIFTLFSEIFALVLNLTAVILISYNINLIINHLNLLVIIDVVLVLHVLFLNIRNMTNFYLIMHKAKSN